MTKVYTEPEVIAECERLGAGANVTEWLAYIQAKGWGIGLWIADWDESFHRSTAGAHVGVSVYAPDPRERDDDDRWYDSDSDAGYVVDSNATLSIGRALIGVIETYRVREEEGPFESDDDPE